MSLITQCPACNTLFKVVPDQLKISEGWVRCGQCREVFDAQAQMTTVAVLAIAPDQGGSLSSSPVVSPAAQSVVQVGRKQDFESSDWINSVNPPQPVVQDSGYPELDNPPSLMPDDADDSALSNISGTHSGPPLTKTKLPTTPSFLRQAQRAQRWHSPWARGLLMCLCLMLIVTALFQVVRHERDRIAAAQPGLAPILQQLCSYTGCSVRPLKHIESVVVDASGFNKMRSDAKSDLYRVTVSLKNNHVLPVALPHIELTLNDSQDQAVLRRVLNPADLGATQFVIAPSGEFSGASTLQIDNQQLAGARVAGYRVLAFYP
jgi:predicted Zn finger-like uncharacterized protein